MSAYYNEIDPYAAQWLRNLIAAGHIAPGEVDERSITDVEHGDLDGFTQCHFFAGIGAWSHALRLASWPDDRPVWTGSCPCQPFSVAGRGEGHEDERHLWPHFFRLIAQRKPSVVFGEQVEAAIRHGWLDLVQADMERIGYAFGACSIPAAGVGAPHIRQRLYFVADSMPASEAGESGGVEHSGSIGREWREETAPGYDDGRETSERAESEHGIGVSSAHWIHQDGSGPVNGFWRDADWLFCRDGRWRPVESTTERMVDRTADSLGFVRTGPETYGLSPLKQGAKNRVGRLKSFGNAIVPQVAQAFIESFMECRP